MSFERPDFLKKARLAWGDALPDWVEAIAEEANKSTQAKVAKKLGVSDGQVSQVIANKYPGNLEKISTMARSLFLSKTVACPAIGVLPIHTCEDWSRKAPTLKANNKLNTIMRRACGRCPFNKFNNEE